MARHALRLSAAVTFSRHIDVAGWTGSWVAKNIAHIMRTVFVFLFFTVLAARVRQNQRVILGLCESLAVARVTWHFVLCIREVAIRTGPRKERKQLFGLLRSRCEDRIVLVA